MSKGLNRVMLIGHVGQDPEIRTIPSGSRTAQFSLATSKRWNDRNGQPQEKTEWHRVVCWEKPFDLVKVVESYVNKGDRLYVEGEIEYRQYQDKDGATKYITEIRARDIVLLGGKDGDQQRKPAQRQQPSGYDDFQPPQLVEMDDLPF